MTAEFSVIGSSILASARLRKKMTVVKEKFYTLTRHAVLLPKNAYKFIWLHAKWSKLSKKDIIWWLRWAS